MGEACKPMSAKTLNMVPKWFNQQETKKGQLSAVTRGPGKRCCAALSLPLSAPGAPAQGPAQRGKRAKPPVR